MQVVQWQDEKSSLEYIRKTVFIDEQKVPIELEWDGLDATAYHVLAKSTARKPAGTGRLLQSGQIGRMAVLREYRGKGAGTAILKCLLQLADSMKIPEVFLNSQLQAVPFYRKHGFITAGEIFNEAGIAHCRMKFHPDG